VLVLNLQVTQCNELWGERKIRYFTEVVHGRVTRLAEVMFANAVCTQHALSQMVLESPHLLGVKGRILNEGMVRPAEGKREGPQYDNGSMSAMLLGSSHVATRAQRAGWVEKFVTDFVLQTTPQGWQVTDVTAAFDDNLVRIYKSADIRSEEILKTEEAFQKRARQNCWVLVHWTVGRVRKPYICVVTSFVGVKHPHSPETVEDLRIAALRVYQPHGMSCGMYVADADAISDECWPCDLDSIDCKLIIAHSERCFNRTAKGKLYGMQFANCTKSY
jgi:hypothetical protein